MNRYYVSPCSEPDGTKTWDVVRRASRNRGANGNTVSNHQTRDLARLEARQRNLASLLFSGEILGQLAQLIKL